MNKTLAPMSFPPLVYDRTVSKLHQVRLAKEAKFAGQPIDEIYNSDYGSFSYKTINRIQDWIHWTAQTAIDAGYECQVSPKPTPYTESSIIYLADIERIRSDLEILSHLLPDTREWRNIEHTDHISYIQANTLEWNLHLVAELLDNLLKSAKTYSGNSLAICGLNLPV